MQNTGPLTTLVVDDDAFVLASLPSFLLRVPKVEIIGTAKDGAEALMKIKLNQPKLVVMDVRMPRMDGIEATGLIRKQFPDIRIVLTSGIDDAEMRRDCLASGADAFMGKLEVRTQFPLLVEMMFGVPVAA